MKSKGLQTRYNKSFETKDSGGRGGVCKFPSDTKFFSPKEVRNRIIIVPFIVKSKKHPLVASGDMDIGDEDYVMDVWVHRSVGPGEVDVVCLKQNYHKACPCCEQAKEYRDAGQEKEYKALKASRRVFYNVVNARKPDTGLQVFAASYFLFEKELIDEASSDSDGKNIVDFANTKSGKIVSFRGAMTSIGKTEFMEFKSISFEDRDEPLDAALVEEAISFDEVMTVLNADEIKKIMYSGMSSDEEEGEPRPRTRSKDKDKDDDSDGSDEEAAPRSRRAAKDETDDEPASKGKKPKDEDDEEPAPRARKPKDDEDEEEDEPRPAKADKKAEKADAKTDTCPEGYNYPEDWDKKKGCEKCKVWDRCNDAYDAMKKKDKD